LAIPERLRSFTASILSSSARQKVMTGMELLDADATVADVHFMLTLYRFKLNVFLQVNHGHPSSKKMCDLNLNF
jgi:hypothetical protein